MIKRLVFRLFVVLLICIGCVERALAQYATGQKVQALTYSNEWLESVIIEVNQAEGAKPYRVEYHEGSYSGRKEWVEPTRIRPSGFGPKDSDSQRSKAAAGLLGPNVIPNPNGPGTIYAGTFGTNPQTGALNGHANERPPENGQGLGGRSQLPVNDVTPPVIRGNDALPARDGAHVPQEHYAYTLEEQGAWHRIEGMPANIGIPTQLAPGTYAAPPVPPGTVFGNSKIPPLFRPKSSTPPPAHRHADLYGLYPQNFIGTWVMSTGGQFTMTLEGPDRDGWQKYEWGGPEGVGVLRVSADGTWTWTTHGKKSTGRWAGAPDTVHMFSFDGEEQFVYWNNRGDLQVQGKSGKLKSGKKVA